MRAVDVAPPPPIAFVADTNVYILRAAGRLPASARDLLAAGVIFHCSVGLAEFVVGLGNLDPKRSDYARIKDYRTAFFAMLGAARILTPDADVWVEAGLVAGVLARTQRFQPHQRKDALNDALIFLTAAKPGCRC